MGLLTYLEATVLHGFKYLAQSASHLSRCYWLMIILSCTALGLWQVRIGLNQWNENPVMTSIEGIYTPISKVQFPTITFCHEDYNQPDVWALTEQVFNFFSFHCSSKNENCAESQKLREDFQPFFKMIYDNVSQLVDETQFQTDSWMMSRQHIEAVVLAIQRNQTTFQELEHKLEHSIGMFANKGTFYRDFTTKIENEALEECLNTTCLEIKLKVNKFFVKVEMLSIPATLGLGTLLRLFSRQLGPSFDDIEMPHYLEFNRTCNHQISDIAKKVHEVMLALGLSMGLQVSLHDLPNFYKDSTIYANGYIELYQHYPLFSYCQKEDLSSVSFGTRNDSMPHCQHYWYDDKGQNSEH